MESRNLRTTTKKKRSLCFVPDCKSAYYPGCGIRFHLFPKDTKKRNKWLEILNVSPDDYHDNAMVCYLHFHVSDYCKNNPENRLKPFALPHVRKKQPSSDSGESDFECIDVEKALDRLKEVSSQSDNDSNDDDINKYFTLASSDDEHVEKKEVKKNKNTDTVKPKTAKKKEEDKINKVKKEENEEEEIEEKVPEDKGGKQKINQNTKIEFDVGNILTHVCGICLAIDCKMYSMKQYNLEEAYVMLTGITVEMIDDSKIPTMLCFDCLKRLKNMVDLSTKSLTAWSLLMELSDENNLTMDGIRSINRQQNLLASNLGYTIYEPNYFDLQIEEYYENDSKNIKNDDIKESIDGKDTTSDNIEYDIEESFEVKEELKLERNHSEDKDYKTEQLNGDSIKNGGFTEPEEFSDNVNYKLPNENANRKDGDMTNGLSSKKVHRKKDSYPSANEKISDGEDEVIQPKEKKNNERYKKEYNDMFIVKIMTPEEQLAEIESRKDSVNYKNAVFKCYKCFRGFNFDGPFGEHMKRHSIECGEFECHICHMRYKSRFRLTAHIRSRHRTFIECRLCPFKTVWKSAAADHKLYHDENRYQCTKCLETFAKATLLNLHVQRKHPETAVCNLCGKSYLGTINLAKHRRTVHHGENLQLPDTCPACPTCNIRFRDHGALRVHFAVSSGHGRNVKTLNKSPSAPTVPPPPPPEDEKTLSLKDEQNGPVTCEELLANAPYCPTCDIHFLDEAALRLHLTVSPNHGYPSITPNDSPSRPLPGNKSGEYHGNGVSDHANSVKDEAALQGHYAASPSRGNPLNPPESPKPPPPKRRVYRKKRAPMGPVTCEQCGLVCAGLRAYMKHFGDAHPTRNRTQYSHALPTYMCELCGKIFQNITILNDHRISHSGARPYACEKCPSTFKTKHDLQIHRVNHTQSRRCSLCGNVYATIGGLMRHIMIHTGKPYSCEPCNKRFCTPSAKRSHIRHAHLGEPWPKKRPKGQFARRQRGGKFQSEADMDVEMEMEFQGEENVLTQYIDEE